VGGARGGSLRARLRVVRAVAVALLALAAVAAGAAERLAVAVGDSPILGPADAPITVVEFVDYQ